MVTNNFPASTIKDFPVSPELVGEWTKNPRASSRQTIHAAEYEWFGGKRHFGMLNSTKS